MPCTSLLDSLLSYVLVSVCAPRFADALCFACVLACVVPCVCGGVFVVLVSGARVYSVRRACVYLFLGLRVGLTPFARVCFALFVLGSLCAGLLVYLCMCLLDSLFAGLLCSVCVSMLGPPRAWLGLLYLTVGIGSRLRGALS